MSRTLKCILIILAVLVVDQTVKILVKTNMTLYEQIPVFGNWFVLHFVENKGMAFGLNLPGDYGKLILSSFRMVAIIAIGWYLSRLLKQDAHPGLLITLSLIMGGAIGNMIDSAFYGMIFSASNPFQAAVLFPEGGGYERFMHGRVVDMFYFPILTGVYPDWFPVVGGNTYTFFRPVFNVADSSITVAVVILLFRQRKYFAYMEERRKAKSVADVDTSGTEETLNPVPPQTPPGDE